MAEIVQIPVSDLLLDEGNPRLAETQSSQQDAALGIARQQGDAIVRLAEDIVNKGLDPTALTAVVATGDQRKRYRVLEGNRRLVALRALETPALISPVLSGSSNRKLTELSRKYSQDPVATVSCALFATEEEAEHWIRLRHTGQNLGVGLVEWGAVEKDRYDARHRGARRPAGQVMDFVDKHGSLSDEAKASRQRILTTLERLLNTPHVREKLGIDIQEGQVLAEYPQEEIARSLTRVVEDLRTGAVTVPDVYRIEQRKQYVDGLPRGVLPKASAKLPTPVVLDDLTAGTATPRPATTTPRRQRRPPPARTTVIPTSANLNVTTPRINQIYVELSTLSAEQYPNACSVLLRVFIELSIDHYLTDKKLMTEQQMRSTPLAKRMKNVVKHLEAGGRIPARLARAMENVADGGRNLLAAPIPTFHLYVHNQYVYPGAAELYRTWDEIGPFMEKVWP